MEKSKWAADQRRGAPITAVLSDLRLSVFIGGQPFYAIYNTWPSNAITGDTWIVNSSVESPTLDGIAKAVIQDVNG